MTLWQNFSISNKSTHWPWAYVRNSVHSWAGEILKLLEFICLCCSGHELHKYANILEASAKRTAANVSNLFISSFSKGTIVLPVSSTVWGFQCTEIRVALKLSFTAFLCSFYLLDQLKAQVIFLIGGIQQSLNHLTKENVCKQRDESILFLFRAIIKSLPPSHHAMSVVSLYVVRVAYKRAQVGQHFQLCTLHPRPRDSSSPLQ